LFFRIFDRLAAEGAFCVLKVLRLSAVFVSATHRKGFAAGVAFYGASKCLAAAQRAGRHHCPPAVRTDRLFALYRFQTGWALKPERAVAGAFWAITAVPLDHLTAVDTRLLVGSHAFPYVINLLLFFGPFRNDFSTFFGMGF
jgi:hypothetical protein